MPAYKSTTIPFFQPTIYNCCKQMHDILQIYIFWTLKVVDSTTQNSPNLQPTIYDLPLMAEYNLFSTQIFRDSIFTGQKKSKQLQINKLAFQY